jgi:signal transduction histidine kinase
MSATPVISPPPTPVRILIVDDDPGVAHLLDRALKREGYATTVALSGETAFEWLAHNQADLMLLDLKLKDVGGVELIQSLVGSGHSLPFLVITGQGDERAAVEMMKRGALDYVVKDTHFIELIPTIVQRALEQIENKKQLEHANRERRRLERELLEISDRELNRLGHDLHDGLGQQLTAIELFCAGLVGEAPPSAPKLAKSLKALGSQIREIIHQARLLSHGLAPVALQGGGLMNALRELADGTTAMTKIACEFTCESPVQVTDATVATHLYRIAQEAVNNALKHGKTKKISVSLTQIKRQMVLTVRDDGCGFTRPALNHDGMGLRVMRYRADLISAKLDITGKPGKGTCVACTLPKTP